MQLNHWQKIFLSNMIALSCAAEAWANPEVFSDYTLEQAKKEAQNANKFLLIDFTASWCPPCKRMESTTWVDADVQSWIKQNAVAIQVDVDKDEKTSAALKVRAMPTIVLFSPTNTSSEFSRQVGFMGSSELLQWLENAKSGKSPAEIEKEQVQSQSRSDGVWAHLSKAKEFQSAGKNAEALEEYVWLWNNIDSGDPNLKDLRVSMLPYEVKRLSAEYPPAKTKFGEIRDAAEKSNSRKDWIILNGALEDNGLTLAWFDKAKSDPKERAAFKALIPQLEPVLYSNSRWTDAADYLYPEPLSLVNEYFKRAEAMKKPGPDTEIAKDFDAFPSMVLLLYGAYVGAGRDAEAQKIADECLRLDNTDGMRDALVNMAKGMRAARSNRNKAN